MTDLMPNLADLKPLVLILTININLNIKRYLSVSISLRFSFPAIMYAKQIVIFTYIVLLTLSH